ncbi:uncharacterized protein BKA55DRAFT_592900 [Fusarium redolens]|uniref:Uncharacterized protein n=1 Tax=Fusarium redolens TaxID=48865 RepID=A0A9P9HDH1_FUSRE|nr:uncharacterized protein BKA55DRAFT_592900 [Fusarium redolens]KAH7255649.1 hypothetical protein BKA55DRAFT_592900 [Fusarium redolens]
MASPADYPPQAQYETSPTSQLQFKKHKVLPRPRSERISSLPIRISSPLTRHELAINTSVSGNGNHPSSPRTLKHQSRRISSGPDLPPTPPRHSRQPSENSSGKTNSPAATDVALRTPQPSYLRPPTTPPNQKIPPTPDVTPPHSTSRPQLLRPVIIDRAGSSTTAGESQSGSFTTAREEPLSSEDEDKPVINQNSRPALRNIPDPSSRIARSETLGLALGNLAPPSEGSSTSRSLVGDWGHNDSDWGSVSEVEQEWDHNLQRLVTVKKRPEALNMTRLSPNKARVVEPNIIIPTQAAKAVRGMPLHQTTETLSRGTSSRDVPPSATSSTIATSDPRRMSAISTKSTVSTVVEAYLLDTAPKRQRTLRHVRKQTILRDPTNASSTSTANSPKSDRSHTDPRGRNRPSAPKSESQSSNATLNSISSSRARREVWKAGGIPVVVVPSRLSSHKTKSREPSLRSHSSRKSSRTTSASPTLNDRSSTKDEPPIVRRQLRGRSYSMSESSDERTMDYPPIVPARSSSLSAPTSRNGSRASSLTTESMKLHNALQEYLNKKKDTPRVPDLRFSEETPGARTISNASESHRRSSSERHDDFLNAKGYGSQNTPFSLASVDTNGTNPVVSEALAVQMYPHQNSSLLMVDHSTKPSESPDETQSEAEEVLDVPMPTDSSEDIPATPPQPKFSLDDVDSPLRNPRAPPEPPNHPPVINFIPATPSGTTPAHEKMAQMGNYFESMNEKPPRRPSVVRRAFNRTRRHSVDYTPSTRRPSSFLSRTLSLSRTGRIRGMPTMEREPAYPSSDDSPVEEDKLHPFWRPHWSSEDSDECDGYCDDDCDLHWSDELGDQTYRYPLVDNRPKGPQRSFSSRMKRTFAVLPPRDGSYYTSYDWPTTERRTIGRTPSGNLRVMRHRSSLESLRRDYNDDERPHSADGEVKRSFWRANNIQRRANKEKRRLSLGSRLEELQNLPRKFSERRREKRSQELRKKISGPKEVRDGVGEVIRSSTARDHYQSFDRTPSR